MSLYRPNSNKTFVLTAFFLFLVALLIIPLRPSVWNRAEVLSETSDSLSQIALNSLVVRDSLVLTTLSRLDTQLILVPNADSTALDTNFFVQTLEFIDTTVITLSTPATPPITIEKADTEAPNLLFLLGCLLLFLLLAALFYKWLSSYWQKQYWLEYSAKLQPLATLSGSDSNIHFDFSEQSIETAPIEAPNETVIQKNSDQTTEETVSVEPDFPELEADTISDSSTSISQEDMDSLESEKPITKTTASINTIPDQTPLRKPRYLLFFVEFFGRLPRIIFEMGRGIVSIFSFFSTGNQKRKPLDLKWQDGISILMILFFLACKAVIFPAQPTSVAANVFLGLLIWAAPALLRLHWGWGVLGILIIFGEFISLVVYVILQALKDVEPSTSDFTIYWIGAAILAGVAALYWLNKKGLFRKFKSLKLILGALVLVAAYFAFLPYINDLNRTFGLYSSSADLIVKLIGIYILYEVVVGILSVPTKRKASTSSVSKLVAKSADATTTNKTLHKEQTSENKKAPKPYSDQELKELFRTKNWYKKAALDQFDMVSMPNTQLDEQSEFIVLYLPDCINLRQLYLSNNNFQEIPYEVSTLDQLEILDLSYNSIQSLSPEIEYLEHLKVLFLAHNNISTLPSELASLSQLKQIDLTGNPLTEDAIRQLKSNFPKAILKFDAPAVQVVAEKTTEEIPVISEDEALVKRLRKKLHKELKIADFVYTLSTLMNQKLTHLPFSVLQEFPNLKSLFLNSNLFTEIPEVLYHLPNLSTLGLSYNKINSLPDKIKDLQNLEELNLSGNPIRSFSPEIIQLKNLKRIDLGNLGLTTFPAFLLKMQQLERINLKGNHILRIPKNIQHLTNLKELSLGFSGLNPIPDEIFTLKNLRSLDWTGNSLEHIPTEITRLEHLEKLAIGYNQNLKSPASILKGLPKLKELHISGLKGGTNKPMISEIGTLNSLEVLWLSYNELTDLPISLFDLSKVRQLSLANNKLATLSEHLGALSNLEYLYLEKNQLTTLPNSIKKLKKLRLLNLSNNPIEMKEKRALQRILPHVKIKF